MVFLFLYPPYWGRILLGLKFLPGCDLRGLITFIQRHSISGVDVYSREPRSQLASSTIRPMWAQSLSQNLSLGDHCWGGFWDLPYTIWLANLMGLIRALWCLLSACPIWYATQLIWHFCHILKKGPLGMGGVDWVGWALWFGAVVVATSECGLFSQGFFLGVGAGACPFTLRYLRHYLLLAGWLPWQLAHFLITHIIFSNPLLCIKSDM